MSKVNKKFFLEAEVKQVVYKKFDIEIEGEQIVLVVIRVVVVDKVTNIAKLDDRVDWVDNGVNIQMEIALVWL